MFHTIKQGTLEYLTADALEGSVHCFSTRLGGVSEGQLSSLNLGTHRGDKPENVRENYRILGKAVGFAPEETWFLGDNPQADVAGAHAAGVFPVY